MFSWICPKCGSEVPPSYNECPNCAAAQASAPPQTAAAPPPTAVPAPDPQPVAAQVPVPPPPAPPRVQEEDIRNRLAQAYAHPAVPAKKPMPAWMVSLITVAICGGALAAIYFLVLRQSAADTAASRPATTQFERPAEAGTANSNASSPFVKNLEVTGFRITEDKKQNLQVRFLVVNHGNAELPAMRMQLGLKAGDKAEPILEVPFDLPSMAPQEVREVSTGARTKLRAYELPDWQFLKGDLRLIEEK